MKNVPKLTPKGRSSTEGKNTPRHPGASPGCLLFFVQRRRDTEAHQGVRAAGMHEEALSLQHSAISQTGAKNHMFSGHRFVKMYYFAIEI